MALIASEVLIIVLLVLANGLFALAETAIVAVRKSRLRRLVEQGDSRAIAALALADTPNRFLSTVQIGITLVGVLAGALGGATLAGEIAGALQRFSGLAHYGEAIGVTVVVVGITLLSVVVGEMVPKRLALNNPLGVALVVARPLLRLAEITSPLVRLLGAMTDRALQAFGFQPKPEPAVTEDEVRALVEQGHVAGVFFKTEKEMVERALALDRKCVGDLMTRRAQIVWLDVGDADETSWRKIVASGHSYFPVFERHRDNVLGIVSVKSLWANLALAQGINLRALLHEPLFVPAGMTALKLLETFKQGRKHLALVTDEFGTVQGLVTLVDVFEEIVGDIPAFDEPPHQHIVRREDGSWLVDASLAAGEFKKLLGVTRLPGENEGAYQTAGGFVLYHCQRVPREGEHFTWEGFRFEVADVDRQRIDKILIQRLPGSAAARPREPAGRGPRP